MYRYTKNIIAGLALFAAPTHNTFCAMTANQHAVAARASSIATHAAIKTITQVPAWLVDMVTKLRNQPYTVPSTSYPYNQKLPLANSELCEICELMDTTASGLIGKPQRHIITKDGQPSWQGRTICSTVDGKQLPCIAVLTDEHNQPCDPKMLELIYAEIINRLCTGWVIAKFQDHHADFSNSATVGEEWVLLTKPLSSTIANETQIIRLLAKQCGIKEFEEFTCRSSDDKTTNFICIAKTALNRFNEAFNGLANSVLIEPEEDEYLFVNQDTPTTSSNSSR